MLSRRAFIKISTIAAGSIVAGGAPALAKLLSNTEAGLESPPEYFEAWPRPKVIGLGGGGIKAVDSMIESGMIGWPRADFIVADADMQALSNSMAKCKIWLGSDFARISPQGKNVSREQISELARKNVQALQRSFSQQGVIFSNNDLVFVLAGMGGGTATVAAPALAQLAYKAGSAVRGVVSIPDTLPHSYLACLGEDEMNRYASVASISYAGLEPCGALSLKDASAGKDKKANEALGLVVDSIIGSLEGANLINLGYHDAKCAPGQHSDVGFMGTGVASGDNRVYKALMQAMEHPLLHKNALGKTSAALFIMSGGADLYLAEIEDIRGSIDPYLNENTCIYFSCLLDESCNSEVGVTIIGLGNIEDGERNEC